MSTKSPDADAWNTPQPGRWERRSAKYVDTGKPYELLKLTFDPEAIGPDHIILNTGDPNKLSVQWGHYAHKVSKVGEVPATDTK